MLYLMFNYLNKLKQLNIRYTNTPKRCKGFQKQIIPLLPI